MNLSDIQNRIEDVDPTAGQDLIYELLAAYGTPQASITKLRTGTYNKSGDHNTVLWKRKVWDTFTPDADEAQLIATLDRAQNTNAINKLKPRFYIARNNNHLAAVDNRTGQTLATPLTDLVRHTAFFMPWTGAEKTRTETTTYIDTRVAKQMAKLYDEIIATNPDLPNTDQGRRNLNTFFSRLLFCFFAEDTGVFDDGIFTDTLNQLTASDGSDTATFLDDLFDILDTDHHDRKNVASHFEPFGYVNGSLFTDRINAPQFSRKARNIVIDCGTLDWTAINPDIFGSMIQAVTAGEDRSNLGMHYTSVENILKVLNPLFLDDLQERYEDAEDSTKKLEALLDHLGEIKVFDPACGSGNFLIIAYKRLRALEHRILQRLVDLQGGKAPLFADSRISLENFYGIEIDDFAHDIAKLSLWFAKHQMNQEYDELFGIERPLIPLTETGAIVCDNAITLKWEDVVEPSSSTYICGNPPYLGSNLFGPSHRADFAFYFGGAKYPKAMDYISLWFLKASDWLSSEAQAAFVSTNSLFQGQQVALLWPLIESKGSSICFGHSSFLWSNNAQGSAGVTCVIVGLAPTGTAYISRIYDSDGVRQVSNINPYLLASEDNTIVVKRGHPFDKALPRMTYGSQPIDGGSLVLSESDRQEFIKEDMRSSQYIWPYLGTNELLSSKKRFCLWIDEEDHTSAALISPVRKRLDEVEHHRSNSQARDAPKWADRPYRFVYRKYQETDCVAVPAVSSERRNYIPLGYFPKGTILSNKVFAVYDARPWLFAVLHSKMHMSWVSTVCGRLASRYSYGNTLGYNTFPFPVAEDLEQAKLDDSALTILAARERWPDRSLAELYDPDKMPANLRAAHEANDALVDSLYRKKPFESDADRMELLLAMYRDLVAAADGAEAGLSKKKGGK